MRPSDRDTIAAVATAPGEGAIGIVRLSGDRAVPIADACFRGVPAPSSTTDRVLTYGRLVHRSQVLDEVLVSVMRAPNSYTGEDVVEFNCHGGSYVLRRALDALLEAGARQAERGEFTRRAYLNGRMDLTQAEAVADLIGARGDLSLESAYFQLRGGLRHRFEKLAEDRPVGVADGDRHPRQPAAGSQVEQGSVREEGKTRQRIQCVPFTQVLRVSPGDQPNPFGPLPQQRLVSAELV